MFRYVIILCGSPPYLFAKTHETVLREYLELPNGIPSHDTIERVFGIIVPEELEELHMRWADAMSKGLGEEIKKILAIDGKTQRGNGNDEQKANHIVSAVDNKGFCIGEKRVDEKSNEITAIQKLLKWLNIKNCIITIDSMGCYLIIVMLIIKGMADYMLGLKKNQPNFYEGVKSYFDDPNLLAGCAYYKVEENAHGALEKREYWQTTDIKSLPESKTWPGLSSIVMTKNTITTDNKTVTEVRYFISSLPLNVKEAARAIRSHWMVESCHWHLDVTFREDANRTLNKTAAYNLNIITKMAINTLRVLDVGMPRVSMKNKRFLMNMNFKYYLDILMSF